MIESRPSENYLTDASYHYSGQGEAYQRLEAIRDSKSKFIMVYLPVSIEINLLCIPSKRIVAWWYNPTNGKALKIGTLTKKPLMKFIPTQAADHSDWVLVLDNSEINYTAPGI
ncbi:hypothetical protein GXP67_36770 [Rhodocytophaga rosea]|uniref:Putative collagen-binding domain-containing protein n=1 Tax=Rhodocytophaga rosea TaxID=2704465 RepID=A0A6C0GUZ2_9BACT|nr:putative collagen-binding domain-containing protein [Rhodocytophaga rosea]QHT71826.1 hypothetical protein GXP67_36770 [Rhodocytophaga rosea]